MAGSLDQAASVALEEALRIKTEKEAKDGEYADAYVRYLRDARVAGWTWERIGRSAGCTARAAERYWQRNRIRAGRLGDAGRASTVAVSA